MGHRISLTEAGKASQKIGIKNQQSQASSQSVPSSAWYQHLLEHSFIPPSLLPSFYARVPPVTTVIKTTPSPSKTSSPPKVHYKQWQIGINYEVYQKWYVGNENYGRLTDQDGTQYWIVRQVINGWYSEKFWWYNEDIKDYVLFVPTGYTDPQQTYKNYGTGLGEFANKYEAAINVAVATFGGAGAASSAIIGRILVNVSIEIIRQILIEKKELKTLDLADLAVEGIPLPSATLKPIYQFFIEIFKTAIQEILEVSIENKVKIEINQAKLKISIIVRIALTKHKIETEKFFGKVVTTSEAELISDITDKIATFVTSNVIYESFKEDI